MSRNIYIGTGITLKSVIMNMVIMKFSETKETYVLKEITLLKVDI